MTRISIKILWKLKMFVISLNWRHFSETNACKLKAVDDTEESFFLLSLSKISRSRFLSSMMTIICLMLAQRKYLAIFAICWCGVRRQKRRSSARLKTHTVHKSLKKYFLMTISPEYSRYLMSLNANIVNCDLWVVSHLLCYFLLWHNVKKKIHMWAYCLTAHNNHENKNNVRQQRKTHRQSTAWCVCKHSQ